LEKAVLNSPALRGTLLGLTAASLSACSGLPTMPDLPAWTNPFAGKKPVVVVYSQAELPAVVQVPRGHQVALETVGRGEISYQCRANASGVGFAWVFVKPVLKLSTRAGEAIIDYEGPPATFSHKDGSVITASPLANAPQSAGNLPYQLFAANRANMLGNMMGITHVQRVANQGGVAPAAPCSAQNFNAWEKVPFQAEYIFYRSL
jgi:hypothetical protein